MGGILDAVEGVVANNIYVSLLMSRIKPRAISCEESWQCQRQQKRRQKS